MVWYVCGLDLALCSYGVVRILVRVGLFCVCCWYDLATVSYGCGLVKIVVFVFTTQKCLILMYGERMESLLEAMAGKFYPIVRHHRVQQLKRNMFDVVEHLTSIGFLKI